ncbi:hypothetical protein F4780DRAFT_789579 [Xylariomycetidae sp. FL0641]|nr:hypothetical protein F4780DRAFT_789579 [Xylariomycetidae sp. FL0641]
MKRLQYRTRAPLFTTRAPPSRTFFKFFKGPFKGPSKGPRRGIPDPDRVYIVKTKAYLPKRRDYLFRPRFGPEDLPSPSFWQKRAWPPVVLDSGVTPERIRAALETYVHRACRGDPDWVRKSIQDPARAAAAAAADVGQRRQSSSSSSSSSSQLLDAATLHYASALIVTGSDELRRDGTRYLSTHVMHTLADTFTYAPSVLTALRLALFSLRRLHPEPQKCEPMLQPAAEAFERLLAREDPPAGPDAWTLKGLLCEHVGDEDGALRAFRRAFEAARAAGGLEPNATGAEAGYAGGGAEALGFQPAWQWRLAFAQAVARIRDKRGEAGKAAAVLRLAADSFGGGAALDERLAAHLAPDDPERERLLLRSATHEPRPEPCEDLSRICRARSDDPGRTRAQRREDRILADEWLAIAREGVVEKPEGRGAASI